MQDPKEIEGTPERAADRGREEDLGFPSPGAMPSLGNPAVVRAMVSEFAGAVVGVRRLYNEDKLTGDQSLAQIHDLATEYGGVVMGRDARYQSLPWNSLESLGRRIKLVVAAVDGVTDPGELLFLTVGMSLVEIAQAHEDGRMSDDDAKSKVQAMLEDTANLIMGLR
jgi:hypothetical protein